jgi:hypothetical protein
MKATHRAKRQQFNSHDKDLPGERSPDKQCSERRRSGLTPFFRDKQKKPTGQSSLGIPKNQRTG